MKIDQLCAKPNELRYAEKSFSKRYSWMGRFSDFRTPPFKNAISKLFGPVTQDKVVSQGGLYNFYCILF